MNKRMWLWVPMFLVLLGVATAMALSFQNGGSVLDNYGQEAAGRRLDESTSEELPFERLESREAEDPRGQPDYRVDGDKLTVYAGRKPSGGYSYEVTSVRRESGEFVVSTVLTEPGPDCIVTDALTYPSDTVRLEREITGPVRVESSTVTRDCDR